MNQTTASEMELINSYSRRELTPEDVYVFSVKLCDNDIDRDNERFTVESLFVLKKLYVGKTGIIDHDPTAKNQRARILSCDVEYIEDKVTAVGEPYYQLMARAYLLRNDDTRELIDSIENGMIKVSIGCSVRRSICSICHNEIHSPLCNHRKGEKYAVMGRAKLCFVELQDPTDAYEFAFVAEPKNELKPCHLVDVPIPHGRLIDADELMKVIEENDYMLRGYYNTTDRGMFTIGIKQAIDEAPTIIEAEV